MRDKFYILNGILIIILLILNVALFGVAAIDWLFWVGVISAVLFFAYPHYTEKFPPFIRNVLIHGLLIVISFLSILMFFVLIILMITNYPPSEPFINQFDIEPISAEQQAVFERAHQMGDEYYESYNEIKKQLIILYNRRTDPGETDNLKQGNFALAMMDSLREIVEPGNEKYLNFLENEPFPHVRNFFYYEPTPNYIMIQNCFKIELLLIDNMLVHGEADSANQRFKRLWTIVDRQLAGNQTLLSNMINVVLQNSIISFYTQNLQNYPELDLSWFPDLAVDITNRRDQAMANSFKTAFKMFSDVINSNDFANAIGAGSDNLLIQIVNPVLSHRLYWPFFDRNATLKRYSKMYFKLNQLVLDPYYQSENEIANVDSMNRKMTKNIFYWKNPIGNFIENIAVPDFSSLIMREKEANSQLTAFTYLLQAQRSPELPPIPNDILTGQPYLISANDDSLQIWSEKDSKVFYKGKRF